MAVRAIKLMSLRSMDRRNLETDVAALRLSLDSWLVNNLVGLDFDRGDTETYGVHVANCRANGGFQRISVWRHVGCVIPPDVLTVPSSRPAS